MKHLKLQKENLKNKRENLQIEGLCAKKDSCEQCRNARKENKEYMDLLYQEWQIDRQIRAATFEIDKKKSSKEYLNWKYGTNYGLGGDGFNCLFKKKKLAF